MTDEKNPEMDAPETSPPPPDENDAPPPSEDVFDDGSADLGGNEDDGIGEADDDFDLAGLDGEADWSNPDEDPAPGFGEIPDGKYQARVDRVELKQSRAGDTMLSWQLTILGPKCAGRRVFRNNILKPGPQLDWLRKDLCACGLSLRKPSELPRRMSALLDVIVEVQIKNNKEFPDMPNCYINRRIDTGNSPERPSAGSGTDPDLNEEGVF